MSFITTVISADKKPGASARAATLRPAPTGLLRRKCACDGASKLDGMCEECQAKSLGVQRQAFGNGGSAMAPPIVHDVLKSPGQPLPIQERAFFEPRFGHDFSGVRIHTDERAADSAAAVHARAYTVGHRVAFGAGEFHPGTPSGRELLAHELAHVVQQDGGTSSGELVIEPSSDPSELDADQRSAAVLADHPSQTVGKFDKTRLRRKLVVDDSAGKPAAAPAGVTNESIVRDYVAQLCGSFTVAGGVVKPVTPANCPAPRSTSCGCLCDMHGLADTWTIKVNDADWPHTQFAPDNTVTVHSPFSGAQFGAWTGGAGEHRMVEPNWLVLGHELCGHGHLHAVAGTHPPPNAPVHGGRTDHDATIGVEDAIATEHGVAATELRGTHASSRHHGESFAQVTVSAFPSGSADISKLPSAEKANLDKAAGFANSGAMSPRLIEIIGHADTPGGTSADVTASELRASAVRTDLISRGVPAAKIVSVLGVGARDCPSPGQQPACRKVDIFLFNFEGAEERHK